MKQRVEYVGIMVGNRRQRKRVLQTHQNYSGNLRVFSFMPSSIRWKKKTVLGLHYTKRGYQLKVFPFPKVVYNRAYGAEKSLSERIETVIGSRKCFNHVNHFNKREIYNLLRETDVAPYLPYTEPYGDADLNKLLHNYRIVYLKPAMGNKGKGVFRCEMTNAGEIYIAEHHASPFIIVRNRSELDNQVKALLGVKNYLVQQGISNLQLNGQNFDVRVLVQKDGTGSWGITNLISRVALAGYFNTSITDSTTPTEELLPLLISPDKAQSVIQTLRDAGLKTANSIEQVGGYHLGELSVDFMIDQDHRIWMIEVNGDPNRTIYKGLSSYPDVYRKPIQYANYLLKKK